MIISISGYAGSGKDTAGRMIQYLTTDMQAKGVSYDQWDGQTMWGLTAHEWEIKKWAGKLKTIASMLTGIPKENFEDQAFKKTNLSSEWDSISVTMNPLTEEEQMCTSPMTVRDFLQKLGTDGLREGLHTNVWVNALMADYHPDGHRTSIAPDIMRVSGPSKWVITDTRFPNEAEAVKKAGGITVRVERPGVTAINAHPSETALDNWTFDYVIVNDGTEKELLDKIYNLLKETKIL